MPTIWTVSWDLVITRYAKLVTTDYGAACGTPEYDRCATVRTKFVVTIRRRCLNSVAIFANVCRIEFQKITPFRLYSNKSGGGVQEVNMKEQVLMDEIISFEDRFLSEAVESGKTVRLIHTTGFQQDVVILDYYYDVLLVKTKEKKGIVYRQGLSTILMD